MAHKGKSCILTNACDMKVCEAPKSKRTDAWIELTSNVLSMTSGSCCVVQKTYGSPFQYSKLSSGDYSASGVLLILLFRAVI